jgi:hypothetical protein
MKRDRPLGLLMQIRPEHYMAIGKVASNWAALELLVSNALWQLAKIDDEPGACLTAQIGNIGRMLDALTALVRLRGGSEKSLSKIAGFAEKTFGLSTKRNRIVHAAWVVTGTLEPSRLEVSARKKLIYGYQIMPTTEVNAVVDAIADHTDRFEEIMDAVFAELEPSPGTPVPPSE